MMIKVLTATHTNDWTSSFDTEGGSTGQLQIRYGEEKRQE